MISEARRSKALGRRLILKFGTRACLTKTLGISTYVSSRQEQTANYSSEVGGGGDDNRTSGTRLDGREFQKTDWKTSKKEAEQKGAKRL